MSKGFGVYFYDGHGQCTIVNEYRTRYEAMGAVAAAAFDSYQRGVDWPRYDIYENHVEKDGWLYRKLVPCEQWIMEKDERISLKSVLRIVITLKSQEVDKFHIYPYVIYKGEVVADPILGDKTYSTLNDAKKASQDWFSRSPQSVVRRDIGFDLRAEGKIILIPDDGVLYYLYETRKGNIRAIRAHAQTVGAVLRKNGYKIQFKEEHYEEG